MKLLPSWCNPCPPYNHAPCHVTSFILVQSMSTIQPCTMSCYFSHLGAIHVHHTTMHHVMLLHSSWCNPCPPYNHAPCHVTSFILVQSMSTIQPCTMSCYFIHLGAIHVHHTTMHHVMLLHSRPQVHSPLAATCHLHFWQNDWDLLYATVVTQGWNRYRDKSQHRKLTLENKILPLLLPGLKPATFQS